MEGSKPLVSRLDRLESLIGILEEKKDVAQREDKPLDLALEEAQRKGSLLDRVASLEDRLIQLYLERESNGTPLPHTSKVDSDAGVSSKRHVVHKKKFLCPSTPTSGPSRCQKKHFASNPCINKVDVQSRTTPNEQQKYEEADALKKEMRDDENPMQKSKKLIPPTWLHIRFLGC